MPQTHNLHATVAIRTLRGFAPSRESNSRPGRARMLGLFLTRDEVGQRPTREGAKEILLEGSVG